MRISDWSSDVFSSDLLIGLVDQLEADEERARAMASIAQSYGLRDHVEPAREWADKALALAEANGFEAVRRAAMLEKGSMLVMEPSTAGEGRAILEETASDAELVGDHVVAARALVNLAWEARQSSRVDAARGMVQR